MSLLETVESVPQLVIQCIFISELRASHDLLLSDREYKQVSCLLEEIVLLKKK